MNPEEVVIADPPEDTDADSRHVCACECGGEVRGVEQFGRQFTWCTKCTPVTRVALDRTGTFVAPTPTPPPPTPDPGETLPRCDKLDGSSLSVVVGNIEAGYFCEAQAVTITDGTRSAVYVPLEHLEAERTRNAKESP